MKLLNYLPDFLKQFEEYQELFKVSDQQLDTLKENINHVLDQAFIMDCDEEGIKRYENLLKIVPNASDTLDFRKQRVLLRWNESSIYTIYDLINALNVFCGKQNYSLHIDDENYTLKLETYLANRDQYEEILAYLKRVLPMNMYYLYSNITKAITQQMLKITGLVTTCEDITIKHISMPIALDTIAVHIVGAGSIASNVNGEGGV